MREATVDLAGIAPGEDVLDVGCGTGEVAMAARRRLGPAGQVYGIDAAPQMIAVARRKAERKRLAIDYRVAAVEALPFPDGTFDVVTSSLMMHHLPHDLQQTGLAEMYRVLKPGGRLLAVDFKPTTKQRGHLALPLLVHRHTHDGTHAPHHAHDPSTLIEAAGFVDVEVGETAFSFLGFVRGRVPE
jgi:demethylmenaquinone methyltransferase/2-methoxy-6-polyprenyl-1,4-benzoquinol methylase/phosphoethanolamine N-methyltransferase